MNMNKLFISRILIRDNNLLEITTDIKYHDYTLFPTIQYKRKWIDDSKEGHWMTYRTDGAILSTRYFENNLKVGKHILYYESGKIWRSCDYIKGKVVENSSVFCPSDNVKIISN